MSAETSAEAHFHANPFREEQTLHERLEAKHGVRIIPAEHESAPHIESQDFDVFGEFSSDVEGIYTALARWRSLPYIADDFKDDHVKRREWRKTLSPEEQSFIEKNKLRSNPASTTLLRLDLLLETFSALNDLPRAAALRASLERAPSIARIRAELRKAGELSDEERMGVLHALEEKVTDAMDLIYKRTRMH